MFDPLASSARTDKWFLGGGKGALYAPPFPKFLSVPGFWDECGLADLRLPRLFTLLLMHQGRPLRLTSRLAEWRPDRMILFHEAGPIRLRETRLVLESQAFVSELSLESGAEELDVFLWALHEVREEGFGTPWQSLSECSVTEDAIHATVLTRWPAELEADRTAVEAENLKGTASMLPPAPLALCYGASVPRRSYTVNLAQRHDDSPLYETSVLPEKLRDGLLPNEQKVQVGAKPYGLLHMVQQNALRKGKPAVFSCGVGLTATDAAESLQSSLREPVAQSEAAWRRYFAGVPQFESSDPFLTSAYWYRWIGLRLNTVDLPGLPLQAEVGRRSFSPFVTEGIGFFRNFITYSAQAHLREVAWMHDPSLALGILANLPKVQREDGSYPGHNYSCRPPRDFYHADFASGLARLEALHGIRVPEDVVSSLERYADYFWRVREGSKVFDMNETGQEYMSRYQFVTENADSWASFEVHGCDAATYFLLLERWLTARGVTGFQKAARIVLSRLRAGFDEEAAFYCDVLPRSHTPSSSSGTNHPSDDGSAAPPPTPSSSSGTSHPSDEEGALASGARSPARPATGFYPWLLGLGEERERRQAERWLLNENEFWLEHGFPATAKSDPTFSSEAEWKEQRLNCPWNGRSWPMVNSHLVDALDSLESDRVGDALMKTVRLLFHDGDPARPCCYEHYNPETGTPALYRGYDDYMHSWIVDLILRHAVGVRPGEDDVKPAKLEGVEWIRCTDIPHPRGRMDVEIRGGQVVSCSVRPTEP